MAVRAQIKQMTDRDLARLWSQYVKELAVLLVLAEGPHPPPEVVERMQELVQRELLLLYIRCGNCQLHALWMSPWSASLWNIGRRCCARIQACRTLCQMQLTRCLPMIMLGFEGMETHSYVGAAAKKFSPTRPCRNPPSPGAFLAFLGYVGGWCEIH